MNNKFIKFLIILNGVMLPVLLGFAIFQIAKDFFPRQQVVQERGITMSDELEETETDDIPEQGLEYGMTEGIYNSTNFMLKVSIENYRKSEDKINMSYYSGEEYFRSYSNLINVIFLDEKYEVIRTLLDKKASISKIGMRGENYTTFGDPLKSYSTITYKIAFEDTNGDGKLNEDDDHDLYVSNLSGGEFTQVTTGIDVKEWSVYHETGMIFIRYAERTQEEQKETKFASYSIKDKKFKKLNGLNGELQKIRTKIIQ